jgi:hypothetical protein
MRELIHNHWGALIMAISLLVMGVLVFCAPIGKQTSNGYENTPESKEIPDLEEDELDSDVPDSDEQDS